MQPSTTAVRPGFAGALWRWTDRNILELGREMRLSYLPPLMVYVAAGISGLTAIVGTFFIKEYLDLPAAFLAALGFWAMLPWSLKMPIGHLVDLIWRHKAGLVYLGAGLIAASLLIMVGLLADPAAMRSVMRAEAWFVLAVLLAPIGYVVQDVVADAMTVEAVPRVDQNGRPLPDDQRRLANTTMQTLGRVAIIGGGILVAAANVYLFSGVESMSTEQKVQVYLQIYLLALIIPVVSVFGTVLAGVLRRRTMRRLAAQGFSAEDIDRLVHGGHVRPQVNWWILGGSLAFVAFSVAMGLSNFAFSQEVVFLGSLAIIVFLMTRLTGELDPTARNTLIGTAIVIFVFRSIPGPGPGSSWWEIDVLGFDQQFLSKLALITSTLTLVGMFVFRRFMAEHSIVYVIGFLTVAGALLFLPSVAMYYGFHEWTAAHTDGVVDQRFIAVLNTAIESPLGQIAMIPMLAWIAHSAPDRLKATFFAVMAAFTNLALSLSQLGTKYLNQIYTVTREVKDPLTGAVKVAADYSQLGHLFITVLVIAVAAPLVAILFVKTTRFKSA
ncbi:MAG TPA: hypothetical protein VIA64_03530 [Burkholderiales bacterium]